MTRLRIEGEELAIPNTMVVSTAWRERADEIDFRTQAFIDGSFVGAASGETLPCISPVAGVEICQVAACDSEDVDRAVRAARRTIDDGSWSDRKPIERKAILLALADLIEAATDELAATIVLDMGKPISHAISEVGEAAACFRYFAEAVDKVYGEVGPTGPSALALITREAIGVVGAVVPWNYPLMMPAWKLAPALAAGNSIVLKPPEQAPLVSLRLGELAAEAGLPNGVVSVVPGLGETAGQAIGRHLDVDKVAFTGSSEIGKLFMVYAGESNMKQISLECGGKSPNIFLADTPELDFAAELAAEAIFINQGEMCNAGSRMLVHESLHDELLARVEIAAAKWAPGDPFDPEVQLGALVDETQLKRVLGYLERGRDEGATVRMGGSQVMRDSGGYFVEPTIFTDVDNQMTIAREEIFGPVLSVLTFNTDAEALQIANDTHYGLAAAIWTRDINKAHKMARALRAGTVYINNYNYGDDSVPFGGYKESGFGRDESLHALDGYSQLKLTYINLLDG